MKINGNNRIGIMESGAELSPKLSQFHGITAYPWATEKLLSDYRKPLCKKEISQKSAFINTKTTPPGNNPTLSALRRFGRVHRPETPRRRTRRFADGQDGQ